jgi:hypothetical protein
MLKLFFSDASGTEGTIRALAEKSGHHHAKAAQLREIEKAKGENAEGSSWLTLRLGIAWNEFVADWCDGETENLTKQLPKQKRRRAA